MSHRQSDGARVNQWGHSIASGATVVDEGGVVRSKGMRPSHVEASNPNVAYSPPAKANPGNVLKVEVGGGLMGSKLSHENEAPFPEKLADFFIKSFCPPGGVVLDPFGGSGTVLASAVSHGRIAHCIDIRESQADLMHRRYLEAKDRLSRSGVGHS